MVTPRSYWIDRSACTAPENEWLRKERAWDADSPKFRAEAKSVCDSCPVSAFCYDEAVSDRRLEGMYAGQMFKIRTEKDAENFEGTQAEHKYLSDV